MRPFTEGADPRRSAFFAAPGGYFFRVTRVCEGEVDGAAAIALGLVALGLRTSRLPLDMGVPFGGADVGRVCDAAGGWATDSDLSRSSGFLPGA